MIITKQECIKAVLTEPLTFGKWNKNDNKSCKVCAVGAILRQKGINDSSQIQYMLNKGASTVCVSAIDYDLNNKNYLNALSSYWEDVIWDDDINWGNGFNDSFYSNLYSKFNAEGDRIIDPDYRWALVDFIEAFFPEQFTIEV